MLDRMHEDYKLCRNYHGLCCVGIYHQGILCQLSTLRLRNHLVRLLRFRVCGGIFHGAFLLSSFIKPTPIICMDRLS